MPGGAGEPTASICARSIAAALWLAAALPPERWGEGGGGRGCEGVEVACASPSVEVAIWEDSCPGLGCWYGWCLWLACGGCSGETEGGGYRGEPYGEGG